MKIVILSFNHPVLTESAVNSALEIAEKDKILLVHNGSLPQNIMHLKYKFPDIEHLVILENKGFSGGANAGLKKAFEVSEWVLFMSNDCELTALPDVNLKSGIYAPVIFRRNTFQIESVGGAFNKKLLQLRHLKSAQKLFPEEDFYVPGAAFVIDKNSFEKLNGFDETLGTYWEDVDLSLRAKKLDIHLGLVEEIQLKHKIGKTCHKNPHYTAYLYQRNRAKVARRHVKSRVGAELQLAKKFSQHLSKHALRADWQRAKLSLKAYYDSLMNAQE
jgi:GT2 family glycosyltransferase